MTFVIFLFQENDSFSYGDGFVSLLAVVSLPRLLTRSNNCKIFRCYLLVSVALPSFFISFSGDLELNAALPISIIVFPVFALPVTQAL